MDKNRLAKAIAIIDTEKNKNKDSRIREIFSLSLNLLEELYAENIELRDKNQDLSNSINLLKGEQKKPDIKENSPEGSSDFSTDQERSKAEEINETNSSKYGYKLDKSRLEKLKERNIPVEILKLLESLNKKKFSSEEKFLDEVKSIIGKKESEMYKEKLLKHASYKKRDRKAKLPKIKINREVLCPVEKAILPEDAVFSGYQNKVVQDLIIKSDNLKFNKEVYYSPSLHKTFVGKVPVGYEREFGPGINSMILSMKYVNNMSEPKILESLSAVGSFISGTYISNYLTQERSMQVFHDEKEKLFKAGLENSGYQQIDDTSCRVNGKNKYVQILGNSSFTTFFTTARKDRLTILDILRFLAPRAYLFNNETFELLQKMNVYHTTIEKLIKLTTNTKSFNSKTINDLLNQLFPDPPKGKVLRTRIMEAGAIAFYHQETGIPVVETLICDDAPQFKLITENLGLCWVHDARHYKKLTPIVESHKQELDEFRGIYWEYYKKLFEFKQAPTKKNKEILFSEFDDLFSRQTSYNELNNRIKKTKAKKTELLLVLKYPEIPLHNNLSENAARVQKRRQDVSLQTKSEAGTKAKDTMMSIVESCKKLGINSLDFIHDRVSRKFRMPPLSHIIKERANSNKILIE